MLNVKKIEGQGKKWFSYKKNVYSHKNGDSVLITMTYLLSYERSFY